ncbi:serine hydrolase domain-containing protein [Roseateles sp.]|uniref:serine hydrolase domain-containing protein n=1 Tax=Roseateles sp. TaxID=1971397 RepID=UPI003933B5DB
MKALHALLLAALVPLTSLAAPLVVPSRIESTLAGMVQRGEVVGVSAVVFENGKEAYFGAFGMADREAGRPMARDTLAVIYSMTKPVTAVALLQLQEQGKLQMDDPIEKHLPEFGNLRVWAGGTAAEPQTVALERPLTIRDLGRNTAGFAVGDGLPEGLKQLSQEAWAGASWNTNLRGLARIAAKLPLVHQPGARWRYDIPTNIQARIVEKVSGQPYDVYLAEHIFKPLGMTSTRYVVADGDADLGKLAATYVRQPDGQFVRRPDAEAHAFNRKDWAQKPGAFGLVSTLDDYAQFARMLLNEGVGPNGARILKPETVRLMATNVLAESVTERQWLPEKGNTGFGVNVGVRVGPPRHRDDVSGAPGEFFWDGAANTLFWVDPKHQIVTVLFSQFFPAGDARLNKAIRAAVYADDAEAFAGNKPPKP